MNLQLGLLIVAAAGLAAWLLIRRAARRRQVDTLNAPAPGHWAAWLDEDFKLWHRVPEDLKARALGRAQLLMGRWRFEGCNGLEVDERMKVLVCVQAALMAAQRPLKRLYPGVHCVLIYPKSFRVRITHPVEGTGAELQEEDERLGESWAHDAVVLAWENALRGARGLDRGVNVTVHEFAHHIDMEDGVSEAVLASDGLGASVQARMARAYDALCEQADAGRETFLDDYGAESEVEFFAVASEAFFDRPEAMLKRLPELYSALADYYLLDPLRW